MSQHSILLVDDEPYVIELVARKIRLRGDNVFIATSGHEGLELARQHQPALIVSDYQMLGGDGLTMCLRLAEDAATRNIPVILLTGRGHRVDRGQLARTSVKAIIDKPFSMKELIGVVDQLLSGARSEAA